MGMNLALFFSATNHFQSKSHLCFFNSKLVKIKGKKYYLIYTCLFVQHFYTEDINLKKKLGLSSKLLPRTGTRLISS